MTELGTAQKEETANSMVKYLYGGLAVFALAIGGAVLPAKAQQNPTAAVYETVDSSVQKLTCHQWNADHDASNPNIILANGYMIGFVDGANQDTDGSDEPIIEGVQPEPYVPPALYDVFLSHITGYCKQFPNALAIRAAAESGQRLHAWSTATLPYGSFVPPKP